MLALARFRGALALVAAAAATVSCGDDTATGGGGASSTASSTGGMGGVGGMGGIGGDGGTGGTAGGMTCPPTEGVTLALTQLFFGEGNSGEWKSLGFNIDGLVSDETSTDVCQPNTGGTPDFAYPDGDDGIDNSFGKNLVPLILTLVPTWPAGVNHYLDVGFFNAMLKMYCLPDTGDAPQITTKVFAGTELGATPQYDGTDMWPVAPEVLADPLDPESSTLVFENSSVIGSTYDSGEDVPFILLVPIDFSGETTLLKLTLYHARVTMTLSDDRKSATGGILGGVLNTEEVIDQMKKLGFSAGICDQSSFQGALTYIRQSSDIMTDGTQDPAKTCDGISFGVSFEMKEVQLGDVGPPAPVGGSCTR